jgi:hypothetical protein
MFKCPRALVHCETLCYHAPMRTTSWVIVGASIALCAACKECPPCGGGGAKAQGKGGADAGPPETDAGVKAAKIGGAPQKVTEFKLYGRAGFDKVNIWQKPDMASERLGYLRRGARARLGDPRYATETCPDGWFQMPEGGFVCQGRGMLVGAQPRAVPNAPHPPRVHELDPYAHGFVRRDWTPSYKQLPSRDQMWQPPKVEADDDDDGGPTAAGQIRPPCPTEAELARMAAEAATKKPGPETQEAEETGEPKVECADYERYTRRKFRNVRQLLSRGFWVSVLERLRDDETGETYYRQVSGDFVPGNAVHMVRPPEFQGYAVSGDQPLPAAIVTSRYAAIYEKVGGKFRGVGPVERLSVYRVRGEEKGPGGTYYQVEGDRWLKDDHVAYFPLRTELPEGVKENEKWIHVDLSRQTLEAYQGLTPAYVTLVSTGLPNTEENGEEIVTETPHGRFRISFKHVTDDMTGTVGDNADVYSVADVPWVQYIFQNVALHGAFWHSKFGQPKSHGCVNLSPADARYLFDWTDPPLPKGWHGVAAVAGGPSTLVIIDGKTPK